MKASESLFRSACKALVAHALRASPPSHAKWIAAATSELDSIPGAYESFIWSLGTVWASYKARVCAMSLTEPQIPKALLVLELLTCFLPSSVLCIWTLTAAAHHLLQPGAALGLATASSIGPIGMALFGRVVVGGSCCGGRPWSIALVCLAGWVAVVILLLPCTPLPFRELPWRDCVLFVVLPLIGTAHYAFLERRAQSLQGQSPLGVG